MMAEHIVRHTGKNSPAWRMMSWALLVAVAGFVAVAGQVTAGGTGAQILTDPDDYSPDGADILRLGATTESTSFTFYEQVGTTATPTAGELPPLVGYKISFILDNVCYYLNPLYNGAFTVPGVYVTNCNTPVLSTGNGLGNANIRWLCNEIAITVPFSLFPSPPTPGVSVIGIQNIFSENGARPTYSVLDQGPVAGAYPATVGTYTLGTAGGLLQDSPTDITATATGDNEVTVTWVAALDTGAQPTTFYKIYRSTDGVTFTSVGRTSTTETTWKDTTTPVSDAQVESTSLASYAYQVSAVNCPDLPGGGESTPSTSASVTPDFRPLAPTGLAAGTVLHNSVPLAWTAPADGPAAGASGVQGYRLLRSAGPTFDAATATQVGTTLQSPFHSDTTVSASSTYTYAVQAVDGRATTPNRGPFSAPVTVTIPPPPDTTPPTVGSLSVTAGGPAKVDLDWTSVSDNVAVTSISVHRGVSGFVPGASNLLGIDPPLAATAATHQDTGLLAGQTYCYRVLARDAAGNTGTSNEACATTDSAGGVTSPTIVGVSPSSGPVAGGTSVTLTGTNFATPGAVTVTFGGTPGTSVAVASATSLTVTTPAHAAGVVDVVVTNPNGQAGTMANAFTYFAPPPPPTPAPPVPLIADAGPTQIAGSGQEVALDGTGGTASGASVFEWAQVGGPTVALKGADSAVATFQAPAVTSDTLLRFRYRIGDGDRWSDPAILLVMVRAPDRAPVAAAGPDQTVAGGARVVLDGSLSRDPDGDAMDAMWTQVAGPAVTLTTDAGWSRVSFQAPPADSEQDTALEFELVIRTRGLASEPDAVRITIPASLPPATPTVQVIPSPDGSGRVQFRAPVMPDAVRYDWDFGDGKTAVGPTVEHGYAEPGRYEVALEVTRQDGTVTQLVTQATAVGGETQDVQDTPTPTSEESPGMSRTTGLIASGAAVAVVGAAAAAIVLWTRRTPPTA